MNILQIIKHFAYFTFTIDHLSIKLQFTFIKISYFEHCALANELVGLKWKLTLLTQSYNVVQAGGNEGYT